MVENVRRLSFLGLPLFFFLLSFLILLLLSPLTFAAPGNSTQCGVVNESFSLSQNILANGTCYTINASNLVINGAGYTITGNGTGIGLASSGFTNVSLQNLTFTNFSYSLNITGTNVNIENGSFAEDALLTNLNGSNLTNNLFSDYLWLGSHNVLSQNTIFALSLNGTNTTLSNDLIVQNVSVGLAGNLLNNITLNQTTLTAYALSSIALVANTTPANDPSGYENLSSYFELVGLGFATINLSYTSSDTQNNFPNTLTYYRHNGSAWLSNSTTIDTTNSQVSANLSSGIYGLFIRTACQTLTTNLTFVDNVTSTGTCFTIGGDNVIVDGAGYTLTGPGSSRAFDNSGSYDNITVKNFANISGYSNAFFTSGDNSSFINNTGDFTSGSYGIYYSGVSQGLVSQNTFVIVGTRATLFFNVEEVTVSENEYENVGTSTLLTLFYNADRITVLENTFSGESPSRGFYIRTGSENGTYTNNTFNFTGGATSGSVISLDTAIGGSGITSGNVFTNTQIYTTGTSSTGLAFGSSANSNTFNGLIVSTTGTTADAISITSSSHNIFTNVTVSATNDLDINVPSSSSNNTFTNLTTNSLKITSSDFSGFTLEQESSGPASPPTNYSVLGSYLNISNITGTPSLYLNLSYADFNLSFYNESTIGLYHYNGSEWEDANHTVNTSTDMIVSGNLTNFSFYAVFAKNITVEEEEEETNSPSSSSGGSGGGGGNVYVKGGTSLSRYQTAKHNVGDAMVTFNIVSLDSTKKIVTLNFLGEKILLTEGKEKLIELEGEVFSFTVTHIYREGIAYELKGTDFKPLEEIISEEPSQEKNIPPQENQESAENFVEQDEGPAEQDAIVEQSSETNKATNSEPKDYSEEPIPESSLFLERPAQIVRSPIVLYSLALLLVIVFMVVWIVKRR